MKRGKLTNRELDELGTKLIKAASADDREIDRIASNPQLYSGVLARIDMMHDAAPAPGFGWTPAFVTGTVLVLFSISVLAYFRFSNSNGMVAVKPSVPAVVYTVDEKPFVPETVRQHPTPINDDRPRPIRAAIPRSVENALAVRVRRTKPVREQDVEPAFHPIGLTERAEEAAIDGRVVRVEMPRSALFALGVNLPLENGTRAVKADLLVGADGTPRGIRLVE